MTKPNDNAISILTALQHLRDTERRQGIEPLQRRDECPQPSELIAFTLGHVDSRHTIADTAARVEKHVAECVYCQIALKSLRSALADEPLPAMPVHFEDPVARWIESGEPLRRKAAPAPVVSGDTKANPATPLGHSVTLHFAVDELMLVGKAKAERIGQTVAKFVNTETGLAMWLFKGDSDDLIGIRLLGERHPGHVTLHSAGRTIPLQTEVDKHGYSTVRTEDITPIVQNKQSVDVVIHQ